MAENQVVVTDDDFHAVLPLSYMGCYICFNGVASLCRFWPDFAFAVIDDLDMCRQEIKEYLLRYIRENCEGEEPEPDSRG